MGQVHCGRKENLLICELWGCRMSSPSSSSLGTLNSRRTRFRSKARAASAGSQKGYIFCARFALPWELVTTSWSLSPGGERLQVEFEITEETCVKPCGYAPHPLLPYRLSDEDPLPDAPDAYSAPRRMPIEVLGQEAVGEVEMTCSR